MQKRKLIKKKPSSKKPKASKKKKTWGPVKPAEPASERKIEEAEDEEVDEEGASAAQDERIQFFSHKMKKYHNLYFACKKSLGLSKEEKRSRLFLMRFGFVLHVFCFFFFLSFLSLRFFVFAAGMTDQAFCVFVMFS